MKKYLISFLVVSFIALITIIATINYKNNRLNICHSDILWIKENGTPDGILMKSRVSLLISNDYTGRMNIYGYIKEKNIYYRLDRAVYFTYQAIDHKNNYSIYFNSLSVSAADSTPQKLFANFIQLEEDKINYYINLSKMHDNIYLIKDEAYSSFTCYSDK